MTQNVPPLWYRLLALDQAWGIAQVFLMLHTFPSSDSHFQSQENLFLGSQNLIILMVTNLYPPWFQNYFSPSESLPGLPDSPRTSHFSSYCLIAIIPCGLCNPGNKPSKITQRGTWSGISKTYADGSLNLTHYMVMGICSWVVNVIFLHVWNSHIPRRTRLPATPYFEKDQVNLDTMCTDYIYNTILNRITFF